MAELSNGKKIKPIATLKDNSGGICHIHKEDGSYVLLRLNKSGKFSMAYQWFPEAVQVLIKLAK